MYKVVIIEDDFRIAEINKSFVEKVEGFEVKGIALNGQSAIDLIDKHKPDLVLLDIYIPDISGEEILLYIKEHHPAIDIMMITAAKEVKTLEFFLRHGIFDYLIKPVRMERMERSLQKYKWFKQKISKDKELEQQDIDALLNKNDLQIEQQQVSYPKGIDPLTLDRVKRYVTASKVGVTAEEAGKQLGISRSTARRYLDFLVKKGEMLAELRYGTVGRPERIYVVAIA